MNVLKNLAFLKWYARIRKLASGSAKPRFQPQCLASGSVGAAPWQHRSHSVQRRQVSARCPADVFGTAADCHSLSCTMPTVDKVLNILAEELRVKLKIVSGLAFPGTCWWLRVCWYVPSILLISGATSASWSDLAFLRESSSMTH